MRKFLCAIAALTLALGLTACGSEVKYTDYEQSKIDYAVSLAQDGVLGVMGSFMDGSIPADAFDEYTNEEVAYVVSNNFGLQTDGYAFKNAIKSFTKAATEVGTISAVRGYDVSIDGDQIIVLLDVDGSKRDAQAEIIFSNDMFMELESAALNTNYSFGEKMKSAGINTLIGMGTVFAVLILIIGVISLFNLIPLIQKKLEAKKAAKDATNTGIDKAVDQIVRQETAQEAEEVSGDDALVAVIAAAIAAYEGAEGTDGFVVRSVRKVRR